jgi:hypothetical protein
MTASLHIHVSFSFAHHLVVNRVLGVRHHKFTKKRRITAGEDQMFQEIPLYTTYTRLNS